MNTATLFETLSEIHPLSDNFKRALRKELIPLTAKKGYILLEVPKIAGFVYYLVQGFAMSYRFKDGKKMISEFWKTGDIMLTCQSFFDQVPSEENIQLLLKSDLLCVSYSDVQKFFMLYPEATHLFRRIACKYCNNYQSRVHDLQHLTAEKRFERLFSDYPEVGQIVSQRIIASYLGITPQSLSRIKRSRR